jgi:hypothetical protein
MSMNAVVDMLTERIKALEFNVYSPEAQVDAAT